MLQALSLDMKILLDSDYNSEGSLPPGPWTFNYQLVHKARQVMEKLLKNEELTDIDLSLVEQLHNKLSSYKDSLAGFSTAMIWIQCLDMISIVRNFVKAERTGNWPMHLFSQAEMLSYFASSGHNNYTKGSYLYIQSMSNLEKKHPEVYQKFVTGHHVVRSDLYWAGLSTDLIIEQTLMRSMKSIGGLTHGRGLTEEQQAVWLLSMPACSAINEAM